MSVWTQLLQMTLLGTERSALAPRMEVALESLGIATDAAPEQVILASAAILHTLGKAASPLKSWAGHKPAVFEAPGESLCTPLAGKCLQSILQGAYGQLLPEWLELAAFRKVTALAQHVPLLLSRCTTDKTLWSQVRPVIGARGIWLAAQNPEWQALYGTNDASQWPAASTEERLNILIYLRQNEPEAAIPLLQSTWDRETSADRLAFLKCLATGLSPADEAFLESCLNDRRKEIRQAAAGLLTQLPYSMLGTRLFTKASAWFVPAGHGKGHVHRLASIPDDWVESLLRDGIILKEKGKQKDQQTLPVLEQMIGAIPPNRWEWHFHTDAAGAYRIFQENDLENRLTKAVAAAALRYGNDEWLLAIARTWLASRRKPWEDADGKAVLKALARKSWNALALEAAKIEGAFIADETLTAYLLRQPNARWDDELTLHVIRGYQDYLRQTRNNYSWHAWHYQGILVNAAYACSPQLFDTLQRGWPDQTPEWQRFDNKIELFLKIIRFRQEMRRGFSE